MTAPIKKPGFLLFVFVLGIMASPERVFAGHPQQGIRYVDNDIAITSRDGLLWGTAYATIEDAVDDLDMGSCVDEGIQHVGGGTIYIADGTYSLPAQGLVVSTSIKFVGSGTGTTTIEVAEDSIGFHFVSASGTGCKPDFSTMKNMTILPESANDVSAAIVNEGADWLTIENVVIDGFGESVEEPYSPEFVYEDHDSEEQTPSIIIEAKPVAIAMLGRFEDDTDHLEFGDWSIIKNSILQNNYRGLVNLSGANGFIDDVTIKDTKAGAAFYEDRNLDAASGNGSTGFLFYNSLIDNSGTEKGIAPSLSPGMHDADHLVYVTHEDLDYPVYASGSMFYNTPLKQYDGSSATSNRHVYTTAGGMLWYSSNLISFPLFVNGDCGIELIDGLTLSSASYDANANFRTFVQNKANRISVDNDEDGLYSSYNRIDGGLEIYTCNYNHSGAGFVPSDFTDWLDTHTDTDLDGYVDDYELAVGTSPFNDAEGLPYVYFGDSATPDGSVCGEYDDEVCYQFSNYYRFLHAPYLEPAFEASENSINIWADADSDGITNWNESDVESTDILNIDTDDDGLIDSAEVILGTDPLVQDTDSDGTLDGSDANPLIAIGLCTDTDHDGAPDDACSGMTADADDDGDSVEDESDNCILVANPEQIDFGVFGEEEPDGYGNACDGDFDDNGKVDADDLRLLISYGFGIWINTSVGDMPASLIPRISKEASDIDQQQWYQWQSLGSGYTHGPSGLVCAGSVPCPE